MPFFYSVDWQFSIPRSCSNAERFATHQLFFLLDGYALNTLKSSVFRIKCVIPSMLATAWDFAFPFLQFEYKFMLILYFFDQGFRWYTRRLRIDEDGDVADEFLEEVLPESLINNDASPVGRFQVKYNTRPTALAMRKQTIAIDGDIRHSLEYQGQLQWV